MSSTNIHLEEATEIVGKVRDDLEHLAQRACDHDTPEGYIDTVQVSASRLRQVEDLPSPSGHADHDTTGRLHRHCAGVRLPSPLSQVD